MPAERILKTLHTVFDPCFGQDPQTPQNPQLKTHKRDDYTPLDTSPDPSDTPKNTPPEISTIFTLFVQRSYPRVTHFDHFWVFLSCFWPFSETPPSLYPLFLTFAHFVHNLHILCTMVAACREFLQTAHNFDTVSGVRTPGFYTPRSEMTRITTFDDLVPNSGVSGRRLQQQLGCYEFWAEELPPTTKTDQILTYFLTVLTQKCPVRWRYLQIDSWKWVKNHYNHCSLPRRHFWLLPTLNLTCFWPQFWGFLQMPISSYLNMGSISTSWNLLPKTSTNLDLILTNFWCSEQLATSSFWPVFDLHF